MGDKKGAGQCNEPVTVCRVTPHPTIYHWPSEYNVTRRRNFDAHLEHALRRTRSDESILGPPKSLSIEHEMNRGPKRKSSILFPLLVDDNKLNTSYKPSCSICTHKLMCLLATLNLGRPSRAGIKLTVSNEVF